jgi:vacuolar-type H+-ATPase subunit H
MASGKMPPALLEHFKKKAGQNGDKDPSRNKEEANSNRKEALAKARAKIEEKNKRGRDKKEKAGEAGPKAS